MTPKIFIFEKMHLIRLIKSKLTFPKCWKNSSEAKFGNRIENCFMVFGASFGENSASQNYTNIFGLQNLVLIKTFPNFQTEMTQPENFIYSELFI